MINYCLEEMAKAFKNQDPDKHQEISYYLHDKACMFIKENDMISLDYPLSKFRWRNHQFLHSTHLDKCKNKKCGHENQMQNEAIDLSIVLDKNFFDKLKTMLNQRFRTR